MTPLSFVFPWTTRTRVMNSNDDKPLRAVLVDNVNESLEITVLRLCLCGMFLYLSTTRNFLLIQRLDIRSEISSDNDSSYLSFMLPTRIDRATKLSTEINATNLVTTVPNLLLSYDNVTISTNNSTIASMKQFSTKGGGKVVSTIVDTAVAPVGAMIESYITNAIQRSVRRVAKPITIQTHPILERIVNKRFSSRLKIGLVQGSRQTGANLALRNIVNKKDFSFLAVSSVVNIVPKSSHKAVSKASKSILTRQTVSIAQRKATTRYLPLVVDGIGKPVSKRFVQRQRRSILKHSAEASMRTIKKVHVGKSIGRLSISRRLRTPLNLVLKIGNGCLVALPVIGGLFSLNFSLQEFSRALEEQKKNAAIPAILFVIAGIADMIDAILHFILSYVAYSQQPLDRMDIIDRISFMCMIASVASLITAELVIWINQSNDTKNNDLL
jgi:hypothetical protein